jgi:actin-related protein 8
MTTILQKSSFPYRDLDLARSQDWLMMDNLKIKICTLEEVRFLAPFPPSKQLG